MKRFTIIIFGRYEADMIQANNESYEIQMNCIVLIIL